MRLQLRPLRFVIAGAVMLLLGLTPTRAAKPDFTPEQLREVATHIVRGKVVDVYTQVRRTSNWENTKYVAEVKVKAVEKGEGVRLDRPLYIRYWSRYWKGAGYPPPGTNGHAPLPKKSAAVRLYLARNAYDGFGTERHDGGYNVIGVNGVQLLTPEEVRKAEAAPKSVLSFPRSWDGVWTGQLTSTKPGAQGEETHTVLAIRPTSDPRRYEFRFRYANDEPWRRYDLVVLDAAKGRYTIDTKEGQLMPATYLDGQLQFCTSQDGELNLVRYRLDDDFLRMEGTRVGLAPDEKGAVAGHAVRVVQRALLRR